MAISPVTIPIHQLQFAPGSAVRIDEISWPAFEQLLQDLGEKRAARVAYFNPVLELMVPLPEHEVPRDLISDLVKVLLRVTQQRYQPFGSTTFRKEGVAGIEPDACFYIKHAEQMIGRRRLEPSDPPPDLAIEADVTSKTALSAYQALGVPELWIYSQSKLKIYSLEGDRYCQVSASPIFPGFDVAQLVPETIERAWKIGSDQAVEEFRAKVN
ncbi:MAG: Uma2 family endonuclease [Cyanobacteria bacterium P01_D01_bin.128]